MSQIERRFCWRCLFFALPPLAALLALGWLAANRIESDRTAVALESDALSEQLTDMEIANSGLRAELGAMREELRAARGAAVASGEGGVEDLLVRLRALPAAQRSALLAESEGVADPDVMAARVVAMTPPLRARFFDTLPGLEAFAGWFDGMEPEGRRAWLRQLPGGDVLAEGGAAGADALSERMNLLRRQTEDAVAALDITARERDQLQAAQSELRGRNDALEAELRAATAPTAQSLTASLARMEPAEQSAFFGAMARNAALADWFERASVEEREAFAAVAPAAMKQAFEGVALPEEGRIGGDEIRRRLADAAAAEDASAERDALTAQLRAVSAGTAQAMTQRLDALEPAEQAAFFGALPRGAAFGGWFERASVEERDAFAALAPADMKQAFEGVTLADGGRIDGDEIRRRLAAAAEAEDAAAERDALAARLRSATAPTAGALSQRLEALEPAEQAAFFGALARSDALAGWFERASVEEREAFAAVAPAAMKQAFEGVTLPGEGRLNGAELRRRLARATALDPTDEPGRLRAKLDSAEARAKELEHALTQARADSGSVSIPGRGVLNAAAAAALIAELESAAAQAETRLARQAPAGADQAAIAERDAARAASAATEQAMSDLRASLQAAEAERGAALAASAQTEQALSALRARLAAAPPDSGSIAPDLLRRIGARIGATPVADGERPALRLATGALFLSFATVSSDGAKRLDAIAEELAAELAARPEARWRLRIEGHTDKRAIATEQFPSNWELSSARAAAVARRLEAHGVPADRLSPIGRASSEPLDTGEDDAALARNRRIEFSLTPD